MSTILELEKGSRTLLVELYRLSRKSRLDEHILVPEEVAKVLHVDVEETSVFVDFLEDKGYIRCGRPVGRQYSWVKLTSQGMDLVIDTKRLDNVFQVTQNPRNSLYPIQIDRSMLEQLAEGSHVSDDVLRQIEESLSDVIDALHQQDDEPLRRLISELVLTGGLDPTIIAIKALLAAHRV
ncbi:hypothetical protein [Alicyclobacillus dauci]|uniref:Transcriptional regulator CtsR n=1 Tax=Alicyclobacillus dauci TaxID=1475485 RepID=A0ABY6Z5I0_9BACL|nr:hypothetical protein [Alicyclobacillus dauci]WAH37581.1 hypothetical protein NZD86_03360 [Alicyclobacillus dauci]